MRKRIEKLMLAISLCLVPVPAFASSIMESPDTGDQSNIMIWVLLATVAILGIVIYTIIRNKKNK